MDGVWLFPNTGNSVKFQAFFETALMFLLSPSKPVTRNIGPVLIYKACNDTEVMDRIKKYHHECRDCLGNPKTMEL